MVKYIVEFYFLDDADVCWLCNLFIDSTEGKGIPLGNQINQGFALLYLDGMDKLIKGELGIEFYGRYMDDGYLIHPSKGYLQECLNEIRKICASLGIKLNERKTQITKLTKGVTFLKGRFFLTDSGKVVKKLNPHSVTSMRRKLKKFKKWVDCGKMSIDDVWTSCKSWVGYASYFDAYHSRQNLNNLYKELFVCTK